ncbi:UNVERIFIED_CONTAM: hypothetical protein Slati_2794200 [Sesamum latifolium]|uniref:Uncharacterized protein n=1 Tax=Sesamum latifolium TaxID=2727402 RepID=A0AAW2VB48_9LAMI
MKDQGKEENNLISRKINDGQIPAGKYFSSGVKFMKLPQNLQSCIQCGENCYRKDVSVFFIFIEIFPITVLITSHYNESAVEGKEGQGAKSQGTFFRKSSFFASIGNYTTRRMGSSVDRSDSPNLWRAEAEVMG